MSVEPPNEPPNLLLKIVCWLLVSAVVGQILLVVGRSIGCFYWGVRCSNEEFATATDTMGALVGTIIALVFAVARLK